ncbi:phosphoribosylaminoimidazolecarboxamide formyltransferase [Phycisphaera mikurensis]|uniref:Putative phosphoribosylaminoimidazolecarboxamide formyltransferase n=1 Tax=Phycisphaera mikurensis (strain NBRC 102666 / KCTC 22515 / FYK2301M01) TaxID=1142394 RepID=I0ICA9_PHYMF|nr:phosphoribosylaminoimidazolecarboxamide formyltransferase [Phycisphaera mikurensis]MBB6441884.1 AICAR transformylase/IMP cyclohydrolase PurH [Phycisphaera mikurensis]BAM02897.1 putative phosphoribosylaminoimidazolecarboxamide formyltransferase [Phycisphaera mikurensis NBRC 102666]
MPHATDLKYGTNPNQTPARLVQPDGQPLGIVNGSPSMINLLDGLRGWQLVRELKAATGRAAAASFKHVSPAGVAVDAGELDAGFKAGFFYDDPAGGWSPIARAYAMARSSDRVASFGDFIAVSEPVDAALAAVIKPEVSDGIIAPGYEPEAQAVLAAKKGGRYVMLRMDAAYEPPASESRTEFGITLEQARNGVRIAADTFATVPTQRGALTDAERQALLVATITLKHTQSNSIALASGGQAIGIGAGQQSRIACTRIACDKADRWMLKTHPKTLGLRFAEGMARSEKVNAADGFVRWHGLSAAERAGLRGALAEGFEPITDDERAAHLAELGREHGIVLSSDAFIPFRDNLDRAAASGVTAVAQAGGSARDADVVAAANEHQMAMAMTGIRLFLH